MPRSNCEFSGSGRQYLTVFLVHIFLLGMVTLGIYAPWAWVRLLRLRASHTRINGKTMTFTGTGGQLLVLCVIHGLLTLVTLGIYWPWAACRISQWKAQHTLIDGQPSVFVGKGGSLFLFSLIHFFLLPALTFGLYSFYAMYRYDAWKAEHFKYGGATTSFGAGFWGVLRIYLILIVILVVLPAVGGLVNLPELDWLAPLICIIVSPWLISMFFEWETRGLVVGDEDGLEHFPPVRTNVLWVILVIVLVLAAVAAAALFMKDELEKQIVAMEQMGPLPGQKGRETAPPGTVRGRVSRPSPPPAPAKEQKAAPAPAQQAPVATASPAKKPAPEKKAPPEIAVPVPDWPAFPPEKEGAVKGYMKEIERLSAFIEKDKSNSDAFYSRGSLHARTGELEQAEADLSKAIEINRRSSDAFYNRGLVRAQMRRFEEAIQDFSEAISLNPNATDAYCNRGNAYFQMGKPDLAMKDYAKALELKPEDPDLYYNRGLIHLAHGRKGEAKADFDKAVALRDRPPVQPPKKTAAGPSGPPAK